MTNKEYRFFESLQIAVASIAETVNIMNMFYIWILKILIIQKQKQDHRRLMVSVNGSIKLAKMNFTPSLSEKVYRSIDEIQLDLDEWIRQYNQERTHSGKYCYGKTPMQTFIDSIPLAKEKLFGYDVPDRQSA